MKRIIAAEKRNVTESAKKPKPIWSALNEDAPGQETILSAKRPKKIKMAAAMGTVPYVAAICNELTVVRLSLGTMLGTTESLAGIQRSVKISKAREANTRCQTVEAKGRSRRMKTLAKSQLIMTFFRSHLSTSTPASGAKKRPGIIRTEKTKPTAVSGVPPPSSVAAAAMARKPSQSPVDPIA